MFYQWGFAKVRRLNITAFRGFAVHRGRSHTFSYDVLRKFFEILSCVLFLYLQVFGEPFFQHKCLDPLFFYLPFYPEVLIDMWLILTLSINTKDVNGSSTSMPGVNNIKCFNPDSLYVERFVC